MYVIKRDGRQEEFDGSHIINAVRKANASIDNENARLTELQIKVIEEQVEHEAEQLGSMPSVENIQDLVIKAIMRQQAYAVAQAYTEYRYKKQLLRQANTTDDTILSIINFENEDVKQENSNKNPQIASTQRDYMAGTVSKDLTWRVLLDNDIKEAHENGLIHFHDADYFAQHIPNCCLINLEDMLQNGTVISGTKIDKPHSFATAANIATQIVAQVASSQYGLSLAAVL